ncbi:erythropoietin receptor [Amia ocellicauda]|uniref:erythropoietin receptor n=1 Tax=Amia ocellicauda TaxID=2972642 RepID=UPI003464E24D|nr:EPOR protein [Amia calva]
MHALTPLKNGAALLFLFASVASLDVGLRDIDTKAALLLAVEPEDPKCFAETTRNLICFWQEDGPPEAYTLTYRYQSERQSSRCTVVAQRLGNQTRYLCELTSVQLFIPLDINVTMGDRVVFNRSLSIDQVFLLDPPGNLTVTRTEKPDQLLLSWLPPKVKYMDDVMMYEVSFWTPDFQLHKTKLVKGETEYQLKGLWPQTVYTARVRVKPDGLSYSGYWSAWTEPVAMETPPTEVDLLILLLSLVIFLILVLLSLTTLLSHHRFLLKKVWPLIPSPENKFPDLFTVYKGDFQEWLGQSNAHLWWSPGFFYVEDLTAPLEVLSEVRPAAHPGPSTVPPRAWPQVPADEEGEWQAGEEEEQQGHLDSEQWKAARDLWLSYNRASLAGPLESKDAYVILSPDCLQAGPQPQQGSEHDVSEEESPLQMLFSQSDPGTPTSSSSSARGSLRHSSGSASGDQPSLGTSSDLYNPSVGLLYPRTWPPKDSSYAYLTVADSGISMDYSPMGSSRTEVIYANEYKNHIPLTPNQLPLPCHTVPIGC